jgi:chorismate dehydratase
MRIGAVSYLNTKPLVYGLAEHAQRAKVVFDLPSRLADELAAGKLDVALIPSVEYFQNPDYTIISDACIGCRGSVLSVKLLSRVPMDKIRTLALDEGSRTSVALVRILLKERYGLSPKLLPFPLGACAENVEADAVLMIGDRAMHPPAGFPHEWDLGDEWCRWAELPFVFAMWVARKELLPKLGEIEIALERARDEGVAHLEEIARRETASVGLRYEQCLSYLRDNLYFYLGPRERRGLELFREHAARLGLVPECGAGFQPAQKLPHETTTVLHP